jgi:hypothetical protein
LLFSGSYIQTQNYYGKLATTLTGGPWVTIHIALEPLLLQAPNQEKPLGRLPGEEVAVNVTDVG